MKGIFLALAAGFLLSTAAASATRDHAAIVPHLVPAGGPNACAQSGARPPCNAVVNAGSLAPSFYYAYVLVMDGYPSSGFAGVQFGITYDGTPGAGVDVFGWTRCSDLDFPAAGWPNSGTGNLVTWDADHNCQRFEPGGAGTGVVATAGYFYVGAYSNDALSIVHHPAVNDGLVASCAGAESVVPADALGTVQFSPVGVVPGSSPCATFPPQCSISGPSTVDPGSTGNLYSLSIAHPNPTISWSISGHGTIVGPANGLQVSVTAGTPGTFHLTAQFSSPSGPGNCSKGVSVFICSIQGSDFLYVGAEEVYSVNVITPGSTYEWSITGNGSIVGSSTGSGVRVRAGQPGYFTLSLAIDGLPRCSRTVNVRTHQQNAKIILHLKAPTAKNACDTRPGCFSIVTRGNLYPPNVYYAYVLVANGYTTGIEGSDSGIAGLQFGIQYNGANHAGVDVFGWTLCADLEFPSTGWPGAGGGNLITWDPRNNCQETEPDPGNGVVAPAGYFYVGAYSPDVLRIIPRPVDGAAKVADCQGAETDITGQPSPLGTAGFGGNPGFNPCGLPVSVESTTWTRIKMLIPVK